MPSTARSRLSTIGTRRSCGQAASADGRCVASTVPFGMNSRSESATGVGSPSTRRTKASTSSVSSPRLTETLGGHAGTAAKRRASDVGGPEPRRKRREDRRHGLRVLRRPVSPDPRLPRRDPASCFHRGRSPRRLAGGCPIDDGKCVRHAVPEPCPDNGNLDPADVKHAKAEERPRLDADPCGSPVGDCHRDVAVSLLAGGPRGPSSIRAAVDARTGRRRWP